jgi:hypothetical protein
MRILDTKTMRYPVPFEVIVATFPNTSFPPEFTPPLPFVLVGESSKPSYNPATQQCREAVPVKVGDQWVQGWDVVEIFATQADRDAAVAAAAAADAINARTAAKQARAAAVAAIKVTTASGKTFDGDEVSQGRMARAIIILNSNNAPSTLWVLSDNSSTQATAAELTEALTLASAAQTAIWVV